MVACLDPGYLTRALVFKGRFVAVDGFVCYTRAAHQGERNIVVNFSHRLS